MSREHKHHLVELRLCMTSYLWKKKIRCAFHVTVTIEVMLQIRKSSLDFGRQKPFFLNPYMFINAEMGIGLAGHKLYEPAKFVWKELELRNLNKHGHKKRGEPKRRGVTNHTLNLRIGKKKNPQNNLIGQK